LAEPLTDLGSWNAATEQFLTAVLETVGQPVWVVDPEGLIRFANPAAIAALGYDRSDELIGRHSHDTIHYRHPDGTDFPASACPMLLPRTTGQTVSADVDWFFRRDGSMFPVSYVSAPIETPAGRGAVVAFTDIEERLRGERALQERGAALAAEQAALRRVATLVAANAPSSHVFATVAEEVGQVLQLASVELSRQEADGTTTVVARWSRQRRDVPFAATDGAPTTSAPIVLDGRRWGALTTTAGEPESAEPGAQERLAGFTELVATAIATTQAREDLRRLADEQAALRRVATLVAKGSSPADVFSAVAREVADVLELPLVEMARYEGETTATVIAATGDHPFQPGTAWPLDGPSLTATVRRTGQLARIDDYAGVAGTVGDAARASGVRAGVAAPIVVDGTLWGVVAAGGDARARLAPKAEHHLGAFTELLATAIANTQARAEASRLAEQQAALRRIATLVAQGAEPPLVFDAVCRETGRLFGASSVNLVHFTPDNYNLTMAGWSVRDVHVAAGTRLPLAGDTVNSLVQRTAAPGRFDSYDDAPGDLAALLRRLGIRSEVGAPVVVEGHVWGALIAGTDEPQPLPARTEYGLADFAALVATAISNASGRAELLASRARIVEATDEQRRRVVRDLHDGAQQLLVHAVINLQRAHGRDDVPPDLAELLDETLTDTRRAIDELRELARGIHPAILTHHGLGAAVDALAQRAPLPVTVDVTDDRYPAPIESAAYFVVAEALTNVAKYANARQAHVTATQHEGCLVLTVADDGVGGATCATGRGLAGLADRMAALGGHLTVDSSTGAGTTLRAEIPLPGPSS
jgi:PAS domain S-box-containing protein